MQHARFDHEKLDVYGLELKLLPWVTALRAEVGRDGGGPSDVLDHLSRAALSALLNTAEGNGKRQQAVRAKFFDDARGSATECAACLDALVAVGACNKVRVQEGKDMLARIVAMLTKLVALFASSPRAREQQEYYAAEVTDEGDDDEDEEDRRDDENR